MTRYRYLILLLTLASFYAGFGTGGRAWPVAAVAAAMVLVLGYFAMRPEIYVPDYPVYERSAAEQTRKWGRCATLLGAILAGMILVLGFLGPTVPGGIPRSVQWFVTDILPAVMLLLLFGGFAVWSLAVARRGGHQTGSEVAPVSANLRYRVLVLLLLAVSLTCGFFQGASAIGLSGYAAAAMPLFCGVVGLAILAAWPEFYNSDLPGFEADGADRMRRRMRAAAFYGLGITAMALVLMMVHTVMAKNPTLADHFNMAISIAAGCGMFLFLGSAIGWCGTLLLKAR